MVWNFERGEEDFGRGRTGFPIGPAFRQPDIQEINRCGAGTVHTKAVGGQPQTGNVGVVETGRKSIFLDPLKENSVLHGSKVPRGLAVVNGAAAAGTRWASRRIG